MSTATGTGARPVPSGMLRLAAPMMLGTGTVALMHTIDMFFLSRLGTAALEASLPANMTAYTAVCFFLGAAGYVASFSAQHHGADEPQEAGAMAWPALWTAVAGGLFCAALIPLRGAIAGWSGLEGEAHRHFCTLTFWFFLQALPGAGLAALIGFFGGLGRTGISLTMGLSALILNTGLNWVLMFGHVGLPALGVAGAGLGTLISTWICFLACFGLFLSRRYRRTYGTGRIHFQLARLWRFTRFAAPHGGRELMELLTWQIFTMAVGHLGATALAASNIVMRLNLLCFIPMVGLSQAVGIAVGQALGAGDPALARRGVRTGLGFGLSVAAIFAIAAVALPEVLAGWFIESGTPTAERRAILDAARPLFLIAAGWGFCDVVTLCLRGALIGAGDTRWPFLALIASGLAVFVLPIVSLARQVQAGADQVLGLPPAVAAWLISLGFVLILALLMSGRYLTGRWATMSVRR